MVTTIIDSLQSSEKNVYVKLLNLGKAYVWLRDEQYLSFFSMLKKNAKKVTLKLVVSLSLNFIADFIDKSSGIEFNFCGLGVMTKPSRASSSQTGTSSKSFRSGWFYNIVEIRLFS